MAVIEVRYCSGPFYGLQLAPPVVTSVEEMSAPAIVTTRSSFPAAKDASKISENADYIVRLQEEGIPELEDEGGNRVANWKNGNLAESEDDFNKPYKETLVHLMDQRHQIFCEHCLPAAGTMSGSLNASSAIYRRYVENEKCKKLRHQESIGDNQIAIGFTRASVKDLHSRVLVSVQKIDFISKKIEDLRDKDLQPELDELIECWKASHRAYLHSLKLWLHKCMKPLKRRKVFRKRNAVVEVSPAGCVVAPIFTTCEAWTKLLDDLSVADLKEAMEGLIADTSRTIPHQGETSDDGMGRVILTGYAHVGRQSTLLRFLGKLEAFSEISLQKYIDLQKEISAAKEMAWRNKFRLLNTGQY
ncbi:hypothetical protein PR202_gb22082 [Eleusine coracana subsp. coracana]|uniref:DUF632 domain-containing protein n=1 Tax=Eleusine coracana subsp. coracana TaxID=191504 RepID=A0AAV5FEU2_ELECO|nr:hypothetical protein PR202_gb22082 [Eleusine coracana subsp. coracana]